MIPKLRSSREFIIINLQTSFFSKSWSGKRTELNNVYPPQKFGTFGMSSRSLFIANSENEPWASDLASCENISRAANKPDPKWPCLQPAFREPQNRSPPANKPEQNWRIFTQLFRVPRQCSHPAKNPDQNTSFLALLSHFGCLTCHTS
jgi:hypothetical protein